jgi:hypothetical protein
MNDTQKAQALLSLYEKCFLERYGRKPILNRYRDKWGMLDMIHSIGYPRSQEIIEYYFKTGKSNHPLSYLFNNFDNIDRFYEQSEIDRMKRLELLKKTKEVVAGEH